MSDELWPETIDVEFSTSSTSPGSSTMNLTDFSNLLPVRSGTPQLLPDMPRRDTYDSDAAYVDALRAYVVKRQGIPMTELQTNERLKAVVREARRVLGDAS